MSYLPGRWTVALREVAAKLCLVALLVLSTWALGSCYNRLATGEWAPSPRKVTP